MKRFILLGLLGAVSMSAQILDVSTGSRCTATFSPATSATDVQIDCTYQSKPVSTTKVNLAAITGNNNGFESTFKTGTDIVTVLLKRITSTSPLHVEAVVNGTQVTNKDVTIP